MLTSVENIRMMGTQNLKFVSQKWFLDSYEYIPVAYVTMHCWLHGYWKFLN